VLVGYSFGGLNVRVYNGFFPNEVAGMVLVESAHEDEPERAPKFYLAPSPPRYLWHPLHVLLQASARIGLLRLTQPSRSNVQNPSQQSPGLILAALERQPKSVANRSTGIVMPESYAQARAAAYQQVWIHQMQAQLAKLSSRGKQIVVENSDHAIADREPAVVVAAVREVVTEIRGEPSER
jgi:pimeloyl-ACP methyl ester carboxylesterase